MTTRQRRNQIFLKKALYQSLICLRFGCFLLLVFVACNRSKEPITQNTEHAVLVKTAHVVLKDVPLYLYGVGSVTAFYSVNMRSRVDGLLTAVHFQEGDKVKANDLLMEIDDRPYAMAFNQAKAQYAHDQALLRSQRLNFQRNSKLAQKELIAVQVMDDLTAILAQQEATVMSSQASMEQAALQLSFTKIYAPHDGRVGLRLVDPGNMVHASDVGALVVLNKLDPIAVIFTLPQDHLNAIQSHQQQAEKGLVVDVFVTDEQKLLASGYLRFIDNQINSNTGTLRLKALFDNPQEILWPNQFVKVRLQLHTLKQIAQVPESSVQQGAKGPYVYVVQADNKVELRQVHISHSWQGLTFIDKGLVVGEEVVCEGQYKIKPQTLVTVQAEP